jgi:DNA-directed RNA polymerase specialized sigma24 family protein
MQTAVDDLLNSVDSVLRNVVRQKLRVTLRTNDFREQNLDGLDVLQDIRLKLVRKLSGDPAADGEGAGVQEFTAYAATVAYRTCSDDLRAKYPVRTSLKNSLRRILDKASEFAIRESRSGELTCGDPGWTNPSFKTDSARVIELRADSYQLPKHPPASIQAGSSW